MAMLGIKNHSMKGKKMKKTLEERQKWFNFLYEKHRRNLDFFLEHSVYVVSYSKTEKVYSIDSLENIFAALRAQVESGEQTDFVPIAVFSNYEAAKKYKPFEDKTEEYIEHFT